MLEKLEEHELEVTPRELLSEIEDIAGYAAMYASDEWLMYLREEADGDIGTPYEKSSREFFNASVKHCRALVKLKEELEGIGKDIEKLTQFEETKEQS